MRCLGKLDDELQARHLSRYLSRLGIQNAVQLQSGKYELWVAATQVEEAMAYLRQWHRQTPKISPQTVRQIGPQPLTLGLVLLCVGLYLLLQTPFRQAILLELFLLPEGVAAGQWWRLLSPVFLHFSLLHIIFNMLWLYLFGTMIEYRESRWVVLLLLVSVGVGSNVAQLMMDGPNFGGMSGVLYGLLGYLWVRSRREPELGYELDKGLVVMMLAWLVICFTGLLGPVANTAHVSGLILGMLWGFWPRSEKSGP